MPQPIGVACLGHDERSRHVAAIHAVDGLQLVEAESPDGPAWEGDEDPEVLLGDPRVRAVAILSPLTERAYWATRCLDSGRAVMAASPPASCLREGEALVAARGGEGSGRLHIDAPSLHSGFADAARQELQGLQAPRFVRLEVHVPQPWLGARGSVLGVHGLWACWLLEELFGPIDAVAAHTRALVRNGPEEDLVLARMEFVNGVEALLEVHALSTSRAAARIEAYGRCGQIQVEDDLHAARVCGLRRQYGRLRDGLRGEPAARDPLACALPQALNLVDWVRRSARLERRLHRGEGT